MTEPRKPLGERAREWLEQHGPTKVEKDSDEETLALRSLSPAFDPKQHEEYVALLERTLRGRGPSAPRNIALTGHYGSGKSSVLVEVTKRLRRTGFRVINLSMPSLGVGEGRLPDSGGGDNSFDKTNLVQKEIVKQLLYLRKPSRARSSRYSRLDAFSWPRVLAGSLLAGLVFAAAGVLLHLPSNMKTALPASFNAWVATQPWSVRWLQNIPWLSVGLVFLIGGALYVSLQRLRQRRVRIAEVTAGLAKVALSEEDASYFDEYLDEIVYFFQTSRTNVVVFEDLDRFDDPYIFETLRELNVLLNNAEQTGRYPIRFVYAIRDSIFERIERPQASTEGDSTSGDRRLASTNRTKFFDLVIPMVPFISHRTSRELIHEQLEAVQVDQRPTGQVVDMVAAYLTDMRLIKNICNEYDVFRERILSDDGLKELTPNRLFAMIVYINLFLSDYELIQAGESRLDDIYKAFRQWASQQGATSRATERTLRSRIRSQNSIAERSKRLGERLFGVLQAAIVNASSGQLTIEMGGTAYNQDTIKDAGFWQTLLDSQESITVSNPYAGRVTFDFDQVATLVGEKLSPTDWATTDRRELNDQLARAVEAQRFAVAASLTHAIAETGKTFTYLGEERVSLSEAAERILVEDELPVALLHAGLIDENFTLYVTQFPGYRTSTSAMNFILKAVQPDVMDMEYHFGNEGEASNTGDIDSVIALEASRLFGGRSAYNIEIFDHLLESNPEKLAEPIRRLTRNAGTDTEFIDAYVTAGKHAPKLISRAAASWPQVFGHLLDQDAGPELIDAALAGASEGIAYEVDEEQRRILEDLLVSLNTITSPVTAEKAEAIAQVVLSLGVRLADLSRAAQPLRGELISRGLYDLTLANVRIAVGGETEPSLDIVKANDPSNVYSNVLAHLAGYLDELAADSIPTVQDNGSYVAALEDVAEEHFDLVARVASQAAPECVVGDLEELSPALWPIVAAEGRIALTATNLVAYIDEHGIDQAIASAMKASPTIEPDADEAARITLATQLLNADTQVLEDEDKQALVVSLQLDSEAIPVSGLEPEAHSLLPALVSVGLVADDEEVFECLAEEDRDTKVALISASANFPTYFSSLQLVPNDLLDITLSSSEAAKEALLAQVVNLEATLGQHGATALAEWAIAQGHAVEPAALATIARRGGAKAASAVVKLLGSRQDGYPIGTVTAALSVLGSPYDQLAAPGTDRPRVPISDEMRNVLAQLESAGIVSKFSVARLGQEFKVSKRHS